ncbi:MAG: hypothetical protein U0361_03705 [Nitrospiraceae bacterium]
MRAQVTGELRKHFRPEFLNRVDEIVVFHALTGDHLSRIVEIQLERLHARLAERRITLNITPAALRNLGERGYDPIYGARPLKRLIQQDIETDGETIDQGRAAGRRYGHGGSQGRPHRDCADRGALQRVNRTERGRSRPGRDRTRG